MDGYYRLDHEQFIDCSLTIFLSGCTSMDSLRYFFLISSRDASGSTCKTSKGFRLKYVEPGRSNRSSCCLGVNTESRFSISFTCKTNVLACCSNHVILNLLMTSHAWQNWELVQHKTFNIYTIIV